MSTLNYFHSLVFHVQSPLFFTYTDETSIAIFGVIPKMLAILETVFLIELLNEFPTLINSTTTHECD